ncbi:MAG: hypothetical protein KY475_19640 [Planctomycetes bacterium]|nr:hypothetical protein [Planctomycetota bacterium]
MRRFCSPQAVGLGLLVIAFAAAGAGCGPPVARVEGAVTHQGQPVSNADLMLVQHDNPARQFFGATGEDGEIYVTYQDAQGAPPGRYAIHVTHAVLRDGRPLPPGEEGAVLRDSPQAVGRTYVFEQELDAGVNVLHLKLENAQLEPAAF